MNMHNLKWSQSERVIARKAYNKAYKKEMDSIRTEVIRQVQNYKEPKNIWQLHSYLTEKRKEIDQKYNYRYSVLPGVFARLIKEGFLSLDELTGLSEDKIMIIKTILGLGKED